MSFYRRCALTLGRLDRRLPTFMCRYTLSPRDCWVFQVHRQDLRLQGLAVCPSRLFVGLFESSSYGISSSSPAGHLFFFFFFFFFSGRLALRRRGPVAPSVTPSCHSLVGSDSRVYRLSKKVGAFPLVDARLPWSTSHFPQVIRASGRAQSVGSSVVHPGTVSSCFPAAESSRSFGQPLGFGFILQASLAASSVALPSILKCSSVGLSFVVVSADSSNQGSMCSWGVSGSVPRWVTLPPPPPPPPSLSSDDLFCFPDRLGRVFSPPPLRFFRHLVPGCFLGPFLLSRTQGSVPGPVVSRSSGCRSVSSDSFGQHKS